LLIDGSRSSIEIARTRRLAAIVDRKAWKIAKQFVRTRLAHQLQHHRNQLDSAISQLEMQIVYFASEAEIVRDLIVLNDEFESLQFDCKEGRLVVTTSPIELEETWLGSFAISLDINSLSTTSKGRYDVIALDHNPSRARDDVPHPHVKGGELCEGHAQSAINGALKQGRLLDFFQIVHGVLTTYNSSSPYVALEDWSSVRCNDCGDSHSPDDGYICDKCDDSICSGCHGVCKTCREITCNSCSSVCESCQESVCHTCVTECVDCDAPVCTECLTNERCKSCAEKAEESESQDESGEPAVEQHSIPEVHTNGLGKVTVPA
jgi:hypothetical protein